MGLFTHRAPTGPYRGAGRPEAALIAERVMDAAARELGLDPLEIRRRNFIPPDAFPYTTPIGNEYDSGDYAMTLEHALDIAGFASLVEQREPGSRARARVRPRRVHVRRAGGRSGMGERPRARRSRTARSSWSQGSLSHGQGHHTSFAQVVADVFQGPAGRR